MQSRTTDNNTTRRLSITAEGTERPGFTSYTGGNIFLRHYNKTGSEANKPEALDTWLLAYTYNYKSTSPTGNHGVLINHRGKFTFTARYAVGNSNILRHEVKNVSGCSSGPSLSQIRPRGKHIKSQFHHYNVHNCCEFISLDLELTTTHART